MQKFTTPMMKQYQDLKSQNPDCILLFRLGDFYEMFLEDAHIGAEVLDITLTSRPKGKDGRIPMAGVPYHAIDSYLPKLVRAGYKVAICEQISPPNTKGLIDRKIIRIVTPGTITDEKALEKKENNFLAAISFHKSFVGLAAVDLSTGEFLANQFLTKEWEKKVTDELVKLHPSECIVSENSYNNSDILKVLSRQKNMNIFYFRQWERLAYRATQILKNHFGMQSISAIQLKDKSAALQAAAVVLGYLSETQKDQLTHLSHITLLEDGDYLQLDKSTIANLELFSTLKDKDKQGSLIDIIDKTVTGMGGRLLRQWMLKPLINRKAILERQSVVSYFLDNNRENDVVRKCFKSLGDIERLTSKLALHMGGAREMVSLKYTLNELNSLSTDLGATGNKLVDIFISLSGSSDLKKLRHLISETVSDEPKIDLKGGGIIREGVDKQLDKLRSIVGDNTSWMEEFEKRQRVRTGINSLKVRFNSVFGFYIEVSKSNLPSVPKDYIRKQTLVNGERFITEELKHHEEKILTASEKGNTIEYKIWQKLLSKFLDYIPYLQELSSAIAVIDCLSGFSILARESNYVRPIITDSTDLSIIGGRHPVVEKIIAIGEYAPNDCFLNTSTQQLVIITGPNMAGKSVYLRQIALLVLLAQIGAFIPAQEATIGIVDRIFVRSGATDAISAGLSTFMLEMVETAHILNQATTKSLIIMDEIGRGTSTYDGISIAWAVAEYLVNQGKTGPKTLFATHYHELQELEQKYPKRIMNMQMAVSHDKHGPIFLHTIISGGASHSYGVAVAKLAGIPESVINRAYELLYDLENKHIQDKNVKFPKDTIQNKNQILDNPILKKLKQIEIDTLTPVEALTALDNLQKDLK